MVDKEDEQKLEFNLAGEAIAYISLDQARVLALQHARDNREVYGRFANRELVWDVVSAEETEDFYEVRLSYRPAGDLRGKPGVEQLTIDKTGPVGFRQILSEPRPLWKSPALLGTVGVVIMAIAIGGLFAGGVFSSSPEPEDVKIVSLRPDGPARMESPGGGVVIDVAAGTVVSASELTYRPLSPTEIPVLPHSFSPTTMAFDLTTDAVLNNPIKITIRISAADAVLAGSHEENILIQHHRDGSWVPLPTIVDFGASTATALANSLSFFALTIKIPELTLTPTPAPSATFVPTATPASPPSPTPEPTATPVPTLMPTLTPSPAPTATPMLAPRSTPTLVPTATPAPTPTPDSTPTRVPISTPRIPAGKITFVRTIGSVDYIFVMSPESGANQVNVSDALGGTDPSWSVSGNQLVYINRILSGANLVSPILRSVRQVHIMNSDGSGKSVVDERTYNPEKPSWSPSGKRIAFAAGPSPRNMDIYTINRDGTDIANVTQNPGFDSHPSYSPDETKIAFTSRRDGNLEIYLMNPDGTDPINLTNNTGSDRDPSWSPDGTRIAFTSTRDGNIDIFVMNADGSSVNRLTKDPTSDSHPSWSPDGARIVFASKRDGKSELYIINSNGTGQTRLTINDFDDSDPSWSRR